ncbi:MAG: hypothetical protein ACMUHU_04160 [Thermoplasmatota archaeon]
METVWLIPVHVRPVISYDGLLRGNLEDPASGLDRFNLTDVGEAFYKTFHGNGAEIRLKNLELPFPWEMVFKVEGDPKASLRGVKVGPSTYRSIFKLLYSDEAPVREMVRESLSLIGRDPLDSPYWDDVNWQLFQGALKLSRDSIVRANGKLLSPV